MRSNRHEHLKRASRWVSVLWAAASISVWSGCGKREIEQAKDLSRPPELKKRLKPPKQSPQEIAPELIRSAERTGVRAGTGHDPRQKQLKTELAAAVQRYEFAVKHAEKLQKSVPETDERVGAARGGLHKAAQVYMDYLIGNDRWRYISEVERTRVEAILRDTQE